MAIGDNFNDLAMLKSAGLSVAVNNAVNDIKKQVDYVCKANNNQGGVAEAINKFILNMQIF
jgi:hydroxymethylpyrimidine pyrophosphatase-like HAD family hydrolase